MVEPAPSAGSEHLTASIASGSAGASGNAAVAAPPSVSVSVGAFAAPGPRDYMEDRHVIAPDFHAPGLPSSSSSGAASGGSGAGGAHLLAVFDGHRGDEAAEFCARHLRETLVAALAAFSSGSAAAGAVGGSSSGGDAAAASIVPRALRDAFVQLDATFDASWQTHRQRTISR